MSTLEHFFKSTSDARSSSSAAVPAFAFLAAQRKTWKVASTGKKRGSYATISEELKAKVAILFDFKLIQIIGYINNINSQVPIRENINVKIQFSWQFAKISSRENFQLHGS